MIHNTQRNHLLTLLLFFVCSPLALFGAAAPQEAAAPSAPALNKNILSYLSSHHSMGKNRGKIIAAYVDAAAEGGSEATDLFHHKLLHHAEEFLRTKTPLSAIERTHLLSLVSTLLMQPTPYAPVLSNDDIRIVHTNIFAAVLALFNTGNRYGHKGSAVMNDALMEIRSALSAAIGPHPILARKVTELFGLLNKSIATIEPPTPWITKKRVLYGVLLLLAGLLARKIYRNKDGILNVAPNPVSSVALQLYSLLEHWGMRTTVNIAALNARVLPELFLTSARGSWGRFIAMLTRLKAENFR